MVINNPIRPIINKKFVSMIPHIKTIRLIASKHDAIVWNSFILNFIYVTKVNDFFLLRIEYS